MWTEKRLQTLYQKYNRRYWNGALPTYAVVIKKCRGCDGFTHIRSRTIAIDVDGHFFDDDVRLTLLHEMVHVAAMDTPPHNEDFWREVDRILGLGAPPGLIPFASRQVRTLLREHPRFWDFFYCKRALRTLEAQRKRLKLWEIRNGILSSW